MKNYFTLIFLICFGLIKGQDKIMKLDKTSIEVKVTEITAAEILYKKWSNQNGPTYSIKKSEVEMIEYKNGEKEVFSAATPKGTDTKQEEDYTATKTPVSADKGLIQVKTAGDSWGFINLRGEFIVPARYSKTYRFSNEGAAPVFEKGAKEPVLINRRGEKIPADLSGFKLLYGMFDKEGDGTGFFPVKKNDKCGFMDSNGKTVVPLKYDDVTEFNEGYATAKSGSSFFVISSSADERPVSEKNIAEIRGFSEGLAPYKTTDKKMGFISTEGDVKIPAKFESVGYFKEGLAWAKTEDGKLGYISKSGEWVIEPRFTAGRNFDKESGLARVKEGEKWAYVSKKGEMVYLNNTEVWEDFSEGLAEGKKGLKRGFLNPQGDWVIPPQFEGTRSFKNGYAAVKKADKWGLIDKQGQWVIEPSFEGIKDVEVIQSK